MAPLDIETVAAGFSQNCTEFTDEIFKDGSKSGTRVCGESGRIRFEAGADIEITFSSILLSPRTRSAGAARGLPRSATIMIFLAQNP